MPADQDNARPCAACRVLRRGCFPSCVFAPHFPAKSDASRFQAVHGVFGASNFAKMLADVELPEDRQRAADTLVEEAEARLRDPAFGCVSLITLLQEYNKNARAQVDAMREQIASEFDPEAAAEPVDVAAADPSVILQARAQVDAALKDAREKDRMLLGARQAADARWLQAQQGAVDLDVDAGKGLAAPRRRGRPPKSRCGGLDQHMAVGESSSKQAMPPMPQAAQHAVTAPGFHAERSHQQMARRQKPIAEREQAMSMPQQMYGHGQMHQPTAAAAETPRAAEASTSRQAPAAAWQHQDSAGHQVGTVPSFLDDGYQSQQTAAETGQWDTAAAVAGEQDVMMTMMQQTVADAWQHQDPAAQCAMTPQQMEVEEQLLAAEADRQRSIWSSHYASLGRELAPWLEQLLEPQHTAAEVPSEQDQDMVMTMLMMQQAAAAGVAPEQDMMMPFLAADAPRFGNVAARREGTELDGVLGTGYGHANVHQQMAAARQVAAATGEVAREQHMAMAHPAAVEQEMVQMAAGAQQQRYAQTELGFTLGHDASHMEIMVQEQQLAAAAKAAKEQDNITRQMIAAGVHAREREQFTQQAAAAERAREQEMTMIQRAAAAQQQHSGTELDVVMGHMFKQQQLAGADGLAREPSSTMMQQHVAAYADAGHESSSGPATAFLSPGSSEAAPPLFINQQLPPQGQTATAHTLQMGSSLPPLPPSLSQSQPYAQVPHQQRAVGGDQGQPSDLPEYLHF
ncbi:hypothetical protein U9M48_011767 [Paspalum notatum var. saurae]|uniref:LOB domain-containing protein n=1 Tax=Paspalum notatum var. saurae TaxID=547442 RepID=A0AAQ3WHP7_PASNO